MPSRKRTKHVGGVEVTSISGDGFTLRLDGHDHFLSYEEYPWFRDAAAEDIRAVERPYRGDLFWEALDVQLHEDTLFHPERYPIMFDNKPKVLRDRKAKA